MALDSIKVNNQEIVKVTDKVDNQNDLITSEGVYNCIYGEHLIDLDTSNMNSGYFYDAGGSLVENPDSYYKEFDLSNYANKILYLKILNRNNPTDARYIVLKNQVTDEVFYSVSGGYFYYHPELLKINIQENCILYFSIRNDNQIEQLTIYDTRQIAFLTDLDKAFWTIGNASLIYKFNFQTVVNQPINYVYNFEYPLYQKNVKVTLYADYAYQSWIRFNNVWQEEVVIEKNIPVYKNLETLTSISFNKNNANSTTDVLVVAEINDINFIDIQPSTEIVDTIYISPNGNDNNNGTAYSIPMKTLSAAILKKPRKIIMIGGTYYEDSIDASSLSELEIAKFTNQNNVPVNIYPQITTYQVINDGSETLVSGKTKVYMKQLAENYSILGEWLYQDLVEDERTLISLNERHPLQKGQRCRMDSTRIIKCSSTTKTNAINEIENSTDWKWFLDEDFIIYFSSPERTSQQHPICKQASIQFFSHMSRNFRMQGINVRYMMTSAQYIDKAEFIDCSFKYNWGSGGLNWYNVGHLLAKRCEACGVKNELNGDGFNGANSSSGTVLGYDDHMGWDELIDCWSHDNSDDGYSNHSGSNGMVLGGLYEYNTKAGITPAYGEQMTGYNIISRNNINGFLLCGDPRCGRTAGAMILYNCYADNNSDAGFHNQFVNSVILVDCISTNNKYGYMAETEDCYIKCQKCKLYNNRTDWAGSGTIVIEQLNDLVIQ